jgi:hypothetical protein
MGGRAFGLSLTFRVSPIGLDLFLVFIVVAVKTKQLPVAAVNGVVVAMVDRQFA